MGFYGDDLAYVHDTGHGDFARAAAPDLLRRLRAAHPAGGTVVDLGCGSGIWAAELLAAGYDVVGVDASAPLLEIARARAPAARLVHASLWEVALPRCVAVTAIGEVLGYAGDARSGPGGLATLLGRVRAALEPGGLLLFDIAGPGIVGPEPRRLWRDGQDWVVLSEAVEDAAARELTRRIVVFRRAGDAWRRSDEVHTQHLHAPDEVLAAVRAAGFEAERLEGWGAAVLRPGAYAVAARRR
jgi:SAM-dependent methyltransferase